MEPRLDYNLPEAQYHADRTSLSSSGARTLLRSPKGFQHQLNNPTSSEDMDLGSLVHALVLGQPHPFYERTWGWNTIEGRKQGAEFASQVSGTPRDDFYVDGKVVEAQIIRDVLDAHGRLEITAAKWKAAHDMADSLFEHEEACELLTNGKPEVSGYATCPITRVRMRGRFDWLREDGHKIDLKTARDGSVGAFRKDSAPWKYDYPLQAAWYTEIAEMNGIRHPDFTFIVVEKVEPYPVTLIRFDEDTMRSARRRALEARELYREYALLDYWPHRNGSQGVNTISVPDWDAAPTLA